MMSWKTALVAGASFAAIAVSTPFADARTMGGGGGGGGGVHMGGSGGSAASHAGHSFNVPGSGAHNVRVAHDHHGRHHRHRFAEFGGPFYDDDYDYDSSCAWLHRNAVRTGSSYWWSRYEDCVNG